MNYDNVQPLLENFLKRGMVISPWLMMHSQSRVDVEQFAYIDRIANEIAAEHWTDPEKIEVFGNFPLSERVPRTAVYEIVASTALSLAHNKFGDLEIYQEQILEAVHLFKGYLADYGLGNIVKIYRLVTSFENVQALHYYRQIPEQIFNLGSWHRPWVDYSLSDDLLWGVFQGQYQIVIADQRRYVTITDKGQAFYFSTMKILDECGYLIHRVRQLQIHNFSLYRYYAQVANEFWPDMMQIRKDFLEWSGIQPGMRVLELGCADGVSTFDAGLAERVGAMGQVIAIDPSMGMIFRANQRKAQLQTSWVAFQQASAEKIPFENESFDAVIAFNSLHFMDLPRALMEIKRVLRANGVFASLHPLKFDMNQFQLIKEWFVPMFKLAQYRKNETPKDYLKYSTEIMDDFKQAGFMNVSENLVNYIAFFKDAEMATNHLIRGVGWMQEELSMVPWKAREDIINEVIDQGRMLCDEYSLEQRIIMPPMQMIKGDV